MARLGQDGQGIERWGDGSVFTGSFKDGRTASGIEARCALESSFARKHGHGKFMWGEGCMYEARDSLRADRAMSLHCF